MSEILGFLVYIDMGNGCLTSKYGNSARNGLFGEAAVRIADLDGNPAVNLLSNSGEDKSDKDKFIGKYLVTWIEGPNEIQNGHLIIEPDVEFAGVYKLVWHKVGLRDKILYHGKGMRYGDILVASYWSPGVQRFLNDPGGSTF